MPICLQNNNLLRRLKNFYDNILYSIKKLRQINNVCSKNPCFFIIIKLVKKVKLDYI